MALVGANVAVAKVLSEALPIALVAFLRCLLACLVLWLLARVRDGRAVPRPAILRNLALQALFGTAIYNAGLLAGLRLTGALEAGLVLSTLPAVVALGAAAWLREKLPPRGWAAVALAVAGMGAITVARADGEAAGHAAAVVGNALVFAGVCGEAIYVLLARRIAGQVPVLTASLWMQVFSAAVLLPFALPGFGAAGALAASPGLPGLLVFHSLTASVLCVVLWYAGLRRVPAGVAGLFTGLLPATAALVAVAALGEPVSAAHTAGFVLMAASLAAAFGGRR